MSASSRRVASSVARRMASAMIGRSVTIQVGTGTVEGVVTKVVIKAGLPKIIVDGIEYALAQILTVAPQDLDRPKARDEVLAQARGICRFPNG